MSSVIISGDTSGAITLAAPAVSGTNTATLPAATGTVMVSGNMPAFSAYTNANLTATGGVATKVLFQVKEYDTNNNFASSTFTPTVTGYYQLTTQLECAAGAQNYAAVSFYKNGSIYARGTNYPASASAGPVLIGSCIMYFNGTTDYAEVYVAANNNITVNNVAYTKFQGVLVRAA